MNNYCSLGHFSVYTWLKVTLRSALLKGSRRRVWTDAHICLTWKILRLHPTHLHTLWFLPVMRYWQNSTKTDFLWVSLTEYLSIFADVVHVWDCVCEVQIFLSNPPSSSVLEVTNIQLNISKLSIGAFLLSHYILYMVHGNLFEW